MMFTETAGAHSVVPYPSQRANAKIVAREGIGQPVR